MWGGGKKPQIKRTSLKAKLVQFCSSTWKLSHLLNVCNLEISAKTNPAKQLRKKIVHDEGEGGARKPIPDLDLDLDLDFLEPSFSDSLELAPLKIIKN